MKDPLWKIVLNWGAVLTFFLLPLSLFILQTAVFTNLDEQKADLEYLKTFMTNITFLVFGLAGLRTWETIKANGKAQPRPLKNVHEPKTIETVL